MQRTKRTTNPK